MFSVYSLGTIHFVHSAFIDTLYRALGSSLLSLPLSLARRIVSTVVHPLKASRHASRAPLVCLLHRCHSRHVLRREEAGSGSYPRYRCCSAIMTLRSYPCACGIGSATSPPTDASEVAAPRRCRSQRRARFASSISREWHRDVFTKPHHLLKARVGECVIRVRRLHKFARQRLLGDVSQDMAPHPRQGCRAPRTGLIK